jgi:Muconolactone delta-isomerase
LGRPGFLLGKREERKGAKREWDTKLCCFWQPRGRKEEYKVQYLVTQEYVDPGPLLPPEQLVGIMRMAVLPGHEAMENLRSEGKILAGGFPVGERAIAFILEADPPEEVDSLLYGVPFWGVIKTKVTPLQDWGSRRELDRQATEQMKQSLRQ